MMAALLAGHSQLKGLSLHEEDCVAVSYHPGQTIERLFGGIRDMMMVHLFEIVVLVIGANDLPWCPEDVVMANFRRLVADIKAMQPLVRVVISEILPRCQSGFTGQELAADFLERWNRQARSINQQLHALAAADGAVDVMVHEHFSRDFLARDGLHLNLRGKRCLQRGGRKIVARGAIGNKRKT